MKYEGEDLKAGRREKDGVDDKVTEAPAEDDEDMILANFNKQVQEAKQIFSATKSKAEAEVAQAKGPAGPESGVCPASGFQDIKSEAQKRAEEQAYEWKGREPTHNERAAMKGMMLDMFKEKYLDLKAQMKKHQDKAKKRTSPTDQYNAEQKQGLQLKGGHRPMERPTDVDLPDDYNEMLGSITVEELERYGCGNPSRRFLLSVWGHVFDVSDRPDKYGPDGPYSSLTGKDITWGLFTGVDTVAFCNRFYDLYKGKDMGKDKLAGICSWLAWYETEYGAPVARLRLYEREDLLPAPPLSEVDDACVVM